MPTSDLATYRIGAAARLTGLSEHLIRIWERRYGAVKPHRAESGVRLYSEADVTRLRLLRRATDRGHAISSIAGFTATELERLAGDVPAPSEPTPEAVTEELSRAFVKAIAALDLVRAEQVLLRADVALGSRATAVSVLIPILHEVGRGWEAGELSVAQEHAAAAVVRNYLGAVVRNLGRDERAPVAVSTTPAGELHEFGALIAAVVAASHGLRVAYLGPNLPNTDLVRTVRSLRANLVLLSAVSKSRGLDAVVTELRDALPDRVRIVLGGAAAQRLKQVPGGVTRLGSVEELESMLAGVALASS